MAFEHRDHWQYRLKQKPTSPEPAACDSRVPVMVAGADHRGLRLSIQVGGRAGGTGSLRTRTPGHPAAGVTRSHCRGITHGSHGRTRRLAAAATADSELDP